MKNCLLWIAENHPTWRVWSNNTGSVITRDNRRVTFGLKGSADIIGIDDQGKFVAIEIKTGNAKQSPAQKAFEVMVKIRGGRYYLIKGGSIFSEVIK